MTGWGETRLEEYRHCIIGLEAPGLEGGKVGELGKGVKRGKVGALPASWGFDDDNDINGGDDGEGGGKK